MPDLRGRALIESRFGKLGSAQKLVNIGGAEYDLPTLLIRLDLGFEDSSPIDVQAISENHFCIRYYDGQDQRIVAHEFDGTFTFLNETRAHIAEWVGDDAYYQWFRSVPFRHPLVSEDD